jgi:predicted phosphodiesterase
MARYAIISDIHGNLAALDAIVVELEKQSITEIWNLGDVIMYGPHPNECLQKLQEVRERWKVISIIGNNDQAVLLNLGKEELTQEMGLAVTDPQLARYRAATQACHEWTKLVLTDGSRELLEQAQPGPRNILHNDVLVHASPCDPVGISGNYLTTTLEAEEAFWCLGQTTNFRLCFFGHTHITTLFEETTRERSYENCRVRLRSQVTGQKILLENRRWLINPGSVGQPRDGDSRAAYAILDTDENCIEFYRADYDQGKTIRALEAAGGNGLNRETVDILTRRLREAS